MTTYISFYHGFITHVEFTKVSATRADDMTSQYLAVAMGDKHSKYASVSLVVLE
jgi:hypothetical protein